MNKKAMFSFADSDFSLFRLLVLFTIVSLFVVFLYSAFNDVQYAVLGIYPEIERKSIDKMILYSPECLAYKDAESGRVQLGKIDTAKFSSARLFECIELDNMNVELQLKIGNEIQNIQHSSYKSSRISSNIYTVSLSNKETGILTIIQYR
ncbi:MAG: hypothetical protein ACMXX7_01260 [Candidatus Woesearchaeota archaeon]